MVSLIGGASGSTTAGISGSDGSAGLRLRVPSFVARVGEVVGICGDNGSGKTTLLRVLAGLYVPCRGTLTFTPAPGPPSRGSPLALLPQKPTLFDATLTDNVTLFDPAPDHERLRALATQLGVGERIGRLPHGWDTLLGGAAIDGLSAGELQRVALMRAMYGDCSVLLLDEPDEGLDAHARGLLANLVQKLCVDRVVVVVAHSPALLAVCDRLYRVEKVAGVAHVVAETTNYRTVFQAAGTELSLPAQENHG